MPFSETNLLKGIFLRKLCYQMFTRFSGAT